jgi:hypothetical protein
MLASLPRTPVAGCGAFMRVWSIGRASALQADEDGFDSLNPLHHQNSLHSSVHAVHRRVMPKVHPAAPKRLRPSALTNGQCACMVYRTYYQRHWGCSSTGRAAALQAVGRGFDSCHLHQFSIDTGEVAERPIALHRKCRVGLRRRRGSIPRLSSRLHLVNMQSSVHGCVAERSIAPGCKPGSSGHGGSNPSTSTNSR